ncbi:morn domain repeat protein [Ichthyophthirius multifiliis]|uniref:Morn domain repeat protein n=1 Tax=Ichthyophthirius multifiliis TaxID=5932 RepID=G0R2K7_ICHMU|nr:morn domain repeat protein [Ichthyophthirius multifiliis]EGR28298.1 morn domain repeat protein [Ichthyophthirius multifiliis]|eukprot:XP_004027643.1 morn domain repeat protein [Ichthyophthirius multifiliis]
MVLKKIQQVNQYYKKNNKNKKKENTIYEGYFEKNQYSGEGILYYQNTNCFFKGKFKDNQKYAGIEICPNGDNYEGEYYNDKYNGRGFLHNMTMHYRYEGNFLNGLRHGYGKEFYKNNSFYEGEFKYNQKYGKGKLIFIDGSYYQGDFVNGMQCGFGIHVAKTKDSIANLKLVNAQNQKNINFQDEVINSIDIQNEFYYEGEFLDGYKHGIGRYFEPNGSYYYCRWEYNRKVGSILYYNANNHSHSIFNYKNIDNCVDHFINPFLDKNQDNIIWEFKNAPGYPTYDIDCCKARIDDCGISGEKFEDPQFQINIQSIQYELDDFEDDLACSLLRISENQYKNRELFSNPIRPNQIIFNELSDYQLVTVLEALTYFPQLYTKIFTIKYEIDQVGFFILKQYIDCQWKEIAIDDYIPCMDNKYEKVVYSTNKDFDIGWIIIQKLFSKLNQSYFYHLKQNKLRRYADQILQQFTALPSKHIKWNELTLPQAIIDMEETLHKFFQNEDNEIKICYLKQSFFSKDAKVPVNFPFIILDYIFLNEPIKYRNAKVDRFLLLKCIKKEYTLFKDKEINNENFFQKNNELYSYLQNINIQYLYIFLTITLYLGLNQFILLFSDIFILQGVKLNIQNSFYVKETIGDFQNNDLKYFFKFNLNLPTKILINIEQNRNLLNQRKSSNFNFQNFPIRILLSLLKNDKLKYRKNVNLYFFIFSQKNKIIKIKYLKEKFIKKLEEEVQFQHLKQIKNQQFDNKNKQYPYKYIFGKGQIQDRNTFKTVNLQAGTYIFMVQLEVPDSKEIKGKQQILIDFIINIFSTNLIQIQRIYLNQDLFISQIYEGLIIRADKIYQKSGKKEPPNFQKSDLSERDNGSDDIIICQYYLKSEGTYLQWLSNKSNDKSWRQKLYFRTENMKIIDQNDCYKVDLHLMPNTEKLIIVQQIKALPYNLEGGEGICIIDKIIRQQQSDEEEEEDKEEMKN